MSFQETVSLPQGGGAVRGLGETFEPNLFAGSGSFKVPIPVSAGRGTLGPSLSLVYSAGNGNGPFGLGWRLSVPLVRRKTETGVPRYDGGDTFTLAGGDDLVRQCRTVVDPATGATTVEEVPAVTRGQYRVTRYLARTERQFARVERWEVAGGEAHWRCTTKDNVTSVFGRSAAARVADPERAERVAEWLLEETFDAKGNHVRYEYARDDDTPIPGVPGERDRRYCQRYLRRILYANSRQPVGPSRTGVDERDPTTEVERRYLIEIVFDYGDLQGDAPAYPAATDAEVTTDWPLRPDPFSSCRPGFEVRTLRRCERALVYHHFSELGGATLVKATSFAYTQDPATRVSLLAGITVTGYRRDDGGAMRASSMPPIELTYSRFKPQGQRYLRVTTQHGVAPPVSLDDPGVELVDLEGRGIPDLLDTGGGSFRVWRNRGGGVLEGPRPMAAAPAGVSLADPGTQFGDLSGDGRPDLLVLNDALQGFFEAGRDGWDSFRGIRGVPGLRLDDPAARLVDLTGDGRSDLLATAGRSLVWFECLGEAGFAPARTVPRGHGHGLPPDVPLDDPAGRVRLADMNGDGLPDIVLLRGRRVDYWPSLGHGRFGPRVTMEGTPDLPRDLDPRRLFMVDVDGSGCADLMLVERRRVRFWLNRGGNGWSEEQVIEGTPDGAASGVVCTDFLGTGTSALVWGRPVGRRGEGFKVLDLCGGVKPHVLVELRNNLGVTTRVTYGSSTRHRLDAEARGEPWSTSLPLAVQVVDKVEVVDHVAQSRVVTSYRYHDGCYDGHDRELCGFGRVDQVDAESFERFGSGGPAYHVPAVETRTWFHTGVEPDPDPGRGVPGPAAAAGGAAGSYRGDPGAFALGGHELPSGALTTGGDRREALRALRGAVLRSETYAHDGTPAAAHPYQVTETRYAVRRLQPPTRGRPGVHHAVPVDALTYDYERVPGDPRVAHQLVLAVDQYGEVVESAAVAYPRRGSPTDPEQRRLIVVYTRDDHIARDDPTGPYYAGVVSQSRSYEVHGLAWPGADPRRPLRPADLAAARANPDAFLGWGEPLPQPPPAGSKRILSWRRAYFRADADSGALDPPGSRSRRLPLGTLDKLALPYECCEAVLPDALLAGTFAGARADGGTVGAAELTDAGYHREPDTPGWWWSSSGQHAYDQLAYYQAVRRRDPFGNLAHSTHDRYALLVSRVEDAAGNVVSAEHDYRVLKPRRVTDPNGNATEVVFDANGLVVGVAALGKQGEGDSLSGFEIEPPAALLADQIANAARLLAGATTRFVYDLERFWRAGTPNLVHTLTREVHAGATGGAPPPIQHSFAYADGFGREIQAKVQAEPAVDQRPRWVASGWRTLNNKGKPVRQFEPFFSTTYAYEPGVERGVSPVVVYDPLERAVATLHPNRTYEKVVSTPWSRRRWDVNDTVHVADPRADPDVGGLVAGLGAGLGDLGPSWYQRRAGGQLGPAEQDAAAKALAHQATPEVAHLDPMGRTIRTVRDGGPLGLQATGFRHDLRGNLLSVLDAAGRTTVEQVFDMLGHRLLLRGPDAGVRWTLSDAAMLPVDSWDGRGIATRTTYDALRRPLDLRVRFGSGAERVVQRTTYGEGVAGAAQRNLRGRVAEQRDPAGLVRTERYDFKGNLLRATRWLAADHTTVPDWGGSPALSTEGFTTTWAYDALNRPVSQATTAGEIVATYNQASLLAAVEVVLPGATARTPVVRGIDYDAKGRRAQVRGANGTVTNYTYDQVSDRLTRLRTDGPASGTVLQDLAYTFDPVGNVTRVRDSAQEAIFFRNAVVQAESDYTYDSLYRLARATGREHVGQTSTGGPAPPQPSGPTDAPRVGLPHPHDGQAMATYTQTFSYDLVDNITSLSHAAPSGGYVTRYSYEPPAGQPRGNRLSATSRPGDPEGGPYSATYDHDPNGNITRMPHLAALEWDHADRLRSVVNGTMRAYYVYDAAGQRVRKVVEKNGGSLVEETLYLGNCELFRRRNASGLQVERRILRVMDDDRMVALIETTTVDGGAPLPSPLPAIRHQLSDHLGSSVVELDEQAAVISREEYYPFGGTSFQSARAAPGVSLRRYRYTGKERDEETGFYHHKARCYVPWLGRWASCDPAGIGDGPNLFAYVRNNPVRLVDPHGTQGKEKTTEPQAATTVEPRPSIPFYGPLPPLIGPPRPTSEFGRMLDVYADAFGQAIAEGAGFAASGVKLLIWDNFGATVYDITGADAYKQQALDSQKANQAIRRFLEAGPDAAMANIAKNTVAGLDEMNAALDRGDAEGAMRGLGRFMGTGPPALVEIPGAPPPSLKPSLVTAEGLLVNSDLVTLTGGPNLLPQGVVAMANAGDKAGGGSPEKPSGAPNKDYWNKQEQLSLEYGEASTGMAFFGQVELYRKAGDKLERLGRILDALAIDLRTGQMQLHEWSTVRNILEGKAKFEQLRYQLSIFDEARSSRGRISIWGRPQGSNTFLDVTRAEQYIGTYLHWGPRKN